MVDKTKDALELLAEAGNYWMVNYDIVQYFQSYEEAIILGFLCSKQRYWTKHNQLKDGKWFFCTREKMREETLIEPRRQKEAINNLVALKLIETENKGQPQKRYFHVNEQIIQKLLIDGKTGD